MTHHADDIGRAARAMTDIEPPTDLEKKIKHRLDAETLRALPRWRPAYWVGAAGLTATAALLGLLVVQGPTRSTVQGSPEVLGSIEVPKSRGPVAELRDSGMSGPRDVGTSGPRNPAVNRGTSGPRDLGTSIRPSEAELAWMSRRIPALEVIDPLAMDRLTFNSIQPDTLSITPLTITPLGTSPVVGDPDTGRQQ